MITTAWFPASSPAEQKRKVNYHGAEPLDCPELDSVAEFLVTTKAISVKSFLRDRFSYAKRMGVLDVVHPVQGTMVPNLE